MTTVESETQRIPALLWESLQEVCVRQDQKFLSDVSRILGVPAIELRKRVLGTRGVATTVLVEHGPWWSGLQCHIVERKESLWTRCSNHCMSGTTCMKHKDVRNGWNIRRYDDPYFAEMKQRKPVRVDGAVYWVSEKGDVVNVHGVAVPHMHIDYETRSVTLLGEDGGSKGDVHNDSQDAVTATTDTTTAA
jgi:hypothetical protein